MRVLARPLCLLLSFPILLCRAQEQHPVVPKRVVRPIENELRKIEGVSPYKFFYRAGFFNKSMLIDVRVADAKRKRSVDSFLLWLNVRWFQEGNIINITDWNGPPPLYSPPPEPVEDSLVTPARARVLDETVITPYQVTTQRQSTITVYQLSAPTIIQSPVNNPMETIEARIPGANIRQNNGVPGSALQIRLGGRHSIQQGNDPLIVVDGVPWATNGFLTPIGSSSAQGTVGASAFNGIPITAIGSISVMQGPAATALYGSRASNGVILITLKEGRSGALSWNVAANGGVSWAVPTSPLLNTQQFLGVREEAVRNDGLRVSDTTVPELKWDTMRHTDFKHMTIGHVGVVQHAHVDANWGNRLSWFLISGRYYRESSVFPGDTHDQNVSLYGNWHYQSMNKRLRVGVSSMGNVEDVHLPRSDYSQFQYLAPNAPPFKDAAGRLQWGNAQTPFTNILAQTYNVYRGDVTTLLEHAQATYEWRPYFFAEARVGYNGIFTRERSLSPVIGKAPYVIPAPVNDTTTANNHYNSGIVEGLLRYAGPLGGEGRLDALVGITYQGQREAYESYWTKRINPRTPSSVPEAVANRYKALFGKVKYVWRKAYILEAALRRDGSSKFGPGYHYGNFGSVGGAWIFREKDSAPGLSFGKVKGGYGTTGNDQINPSIYDTATARMLNNNVRWELNYRAEFGVDLGFARNKLLFSAGVYRSWTRDQLIYGLPGRGRGLARFMLMPANVLNEGLELQVQALDIKLGPVGWTSQLAVTVPRNVLRSFPTLDSTALAVTMVVGQSLSVTKNYHLTGVDPSTGLYMFSGVPLGGAGTAKDQVPGPSLDPKVFVGWSNTLSYGNWQLSVLLDWQRQKGLNPLAVIDKHNPAGFQNGSALSNGPVEWLDHWRNAGDRSSRQRLTTGGDARAFQALLNYFQSDGLYRDASYMRVKTVALSYRWSAEQLKSRRVEGMGVFLRGQDLWRVSKYPVTDAETQDPYGLPPMRVVTVGFSISFKNK